MSEILYEPGFTYSNQMNAGIDMAIMNTPDNSIIGATSTRKGMVLPFQPLSLAFDHVNYFVDMPAVIPFLQCLSSFKYYTCHFIVREI